MENKTWKERLHDLMHGKKLPKKNQLAVLLLAGLCIFVAAVPVRDSPKGAGESEEADPESTDLSEHEYEEYLEKKTREILEEVEGAGKVSVMITLRSGEQKVVEKDRTETQQKTEEEDSEGGTRRTDESSSDRTSIYEQGADGTSVPYVSQVLSPEVEGVIVIADGGDDAVVVRNITEAVQALFGVEAHKIKIMKRA